MSKTPAILKTPKISTITSITSLPDLCLIKVLEKLPLPDLLRLNAVCRRFAELQLVALLKRTSLAICDLSMATFYLDALDFYGLSEHLTFDLVVEYEFTTPLTPTKLNRKADLRKFNSIKPKSIIFNGKTCNALIERLPNVRRLTLANYTKTLLNDAHTVEMLKAWTPGLTHLTLLGFNNWEMIEPYINHLTNLQYLSAWIDLCQLAKLTISPQLTEFYVKYSRLGDQAEGEMKEDDILKNLVEGPKSRITKYGLYYAFPELPPFYYFESETLKHPPPISVVQKLTRLSIKLLNYDQLDFLTSTFRYLKYLHLDYHYIEINGDPTQKPLTAILARLSNFQFLTNLSLDIIHCSNYTGNSIAEISNDLLENSTSSILWVKVVKFHFPLNPHTLSTIERLLPNVQHASFRVLSCTELKNGLLCSDDRCTNCGHVEAVIGQYREMAEKKVIHFFSVDFAFKYGKIIAHSVRFG